MRRDERALLIMIFVGQGWTGRTEGAGNVNPQLEKEKGGGHGD